MISLIRLKLQNVL